MNFLRAGVFVLGSLVMTTSLHAAEGGSSHFLPGVAGDPGMALPPAPGFQVASIVWSQSGPRRKVGNLASLSAMPVFRVWNPVELSEPQRCLNEPNAPFATCPGSQNQSMPSEIGDGFQECVLRTPEPGSNKEIHRGSLLFRHFPLRRRNIVVAVHRRCDAAVPPHAVRRSSGCLFFRQTLSSSNGSGLL